MKIALVSPGYAPRIGGVEKHVANIARSMVEAGHQVDVLTQETHPSLAGEEVLDGVNIHRFRPAMGGEHLNISTDLFRYLGANATRYDIIHGHNYHSTVALAAALRSHGNFVFTPHYHGGSQSAVRDALHKVYRPVGREIARRARAVICVTEAEASLFAKHFPDAAGNVRVIPNGVDVDSIRRAIPYPRGPVPVTLVVGRLEEYKRVDRVIDAMQYLRGRCRLVVIGDGAQFDDLQERTDRLGLSDDVVLLGNVKTDELHRWYRSARVVVGMSTHEAFGMTLVEGAAADAAVLASAIPAHREVMQNIYGRTDCLVPLDITTAELAQRLEHALCDYRRPTTSGIASWTDVTAQTVVTYEDVLRSRLTALAS